jgi:dihydrofolate reductase
MSRKVILGFGISLDGYIARRNRAMDFLVLDKEGEALMMDFFAKIDTTILGRKTAAATAEMRKSGEIPEMTGISNYVFSRRWKPGKRDGFEVVSGSLTAFVKKLKRRPGKDIYLGGGGEYRGGDRNAQSRSLPAFREAQRLREGAGFKLASSLKAMLQQSSTS